MEPFYVFCLLFFRHFETSLHLLQFVSENAETMFCREVPEKFWGLQNLTWLSMSMGGVIRWMNEFPLLGERFPLTYCSLSFSSRYQRGTRVRCQVSCDKLSHGSLVTQLGKLNSRYRSSSQNLLGKLKTSHSWPNWNRDFKIHILPTGTRINQVASVKKEVNERKQ